MEIFYITVIFTLQNPYVSLLILSLHIMDITIIMAMISTTIEL